ncbi:hypothetical protein PQR62_12960 [Herbaspirillum lusitanum]|uniref:Uncharacterized protein n=1 Tax=Herbaspirillum lusitanum TaxID=213312 RepID=A0ABW9A9V7_9BURK
MDRSPLYPFFEKRLRNGFARIIHRQLTPWLMLDSGENINVRDFAGNPISFQSISFDGYARKTFWDNYVQPFIEEMAEREISMAVTTAAARGLEVTRTLHELEHLLMAGSLEVFQKMAAIDQRLHCSKHGHDESQAHTQRCIDAELLRIQSYVSALVESELNAWHPKSALALWHDKHGFALWTITTLIALAGMTHSILT